MGNLKIKKKNDFQADFSETVSCYLIRFVSGSKVKSVTAKKPHITDITLFASEPVMTKSQKKICHSKVGLESRFRCKRRWSLSRLLPDTPQVGGSENNRLFIIEKFT